MGFILFFYFFAASKDTAFHLTNQCRNPLKALCVTLFLEDNQIGESRRWSKRFLVRSSNEILTRSNQVAKPRYSTPVQLGTRSATCKLQLGHARYV